MDKTERKMLGGADAILNRAAKKRPTQEVTREQGRAGGERVSQAGV